MSGVRASVWLPRAARVAGRPSEMRYFYINKAYLLFILPLLQNKFNTIDKQQV
jgi:hypothetical protein